MTDRHDGARPAEGSTTRGLRVRPFRIPDTVDDPAISDIASATALRNADSRRVHGSDAYDVTVAQMLTSWHDQADWASIGLLVEDGDDILATASATLVREEGARSAGVNVRVRQDARRRGIGSMLLVETERVAVEAGRSVLQAWTEHAPDASVGTVTAATGAGSVPHDATARFALAHGYRLEQVYRNSALDLDRDRAEIDRLWAAARASASADYVFEWWETPTPASAVDGFALLKSRMATDSPSGAMEVEDAAWDAARVARIEANDAAGGFRRVVGAICHVPSGRLVALNELSVDTSRPSFAHQNDTLVLKEHRGHRLGMLVKCETLARMREVFPGLERIETYNAEENRPMLAINEAMGFAPVLYSGEWQKTVSVS